MTALRLALLTGLVMACFAGNSVLNRLGVGGGLADPVTFALVRVAAGAVALAGLVVAAGRWPTGATGSALRARTPGAVTLVVYLFGFSLAYGTLDAGTGALVLFGMVQVTLFGGAVLLGDRVPPGRWAGTLLALVELAILLVPGMGMDAPPPAAASLLMATAGVAWGLYALAGRSAADPLAETAGNFVLAVPLAAVAAGLWWAVGGTGGITTAGAGLAVVSGAVTSGLGYALWYAVLPQLGPSRAGAAQLTVPLLAAAGGAVLLAEPVGLRFAVAAALVLAGMLLALRPARG
jgi:drug/metabolite transporter (DMT)-like permease